MSHSIQAMHTAPSRSRAFARFLFLAMGLTLAAAAHASSPIPHLYWTDNDTNELWRSPASNAFAEQALPRNFADAVEVDPVGGWMYFGLHGDGPERLLRARLDGTDLQVVAEGVGFILDLEIDAGTGKIYWPDEDSGQIRRTDLGGGSVEVLVTGLTDPSALALDLANDRIYFNSDDTLWRANLDGTSAVQLAVLGYTPEDLEVSGGNLFLSSNGPIEGLMRCDLDGQSCTLLVPGDVLEMEFDGSTLYHLRGDDDLWRIEANGTGEQQVSFGADFFDPFDLDPVGQTLYLPEAGFIATSNLDGSMRQAVLSFEAPGSHDVAFDISTGRLVLLDEAADGIVSIAPDAEFPDLEAAGLNLGRVRGKVFDSGSGKLYWVEIDGAGGGDGGLWRVNLDGSALEEIVPDLTTPHDLALDLANAKVYWTEAIGPGGGTSASIRRADLDGTSAENIVAGRDEGIRGIAVDPPGAKIYWTDHGDVDAIWWADLDGSMAEALPITTTQPHDLAVGAGFLYWTEGIGEGMGPNGKIRRSALDGTGAEDFLTGLPDTIRDLAIFWHDPLPLFTDGFESGDTSSWTTTVSP